MHEVLWVQRLTIRALCFTLKNHLTENQASSCRILDAPFIVTGRYEDSWGLNRAHDGANLLIFFMLTDLWLVACLLRQDLTIMYDARHALHSRPDIFAFLHVHCYIIRRGR